MCKTHMDLYVYLIIVPEIAANFIGEENCRPPSKSLINFAMHAR